MESVPDTGYPTPKPRRRRWLRTVVRAFGVLFVAYVALLFLVPAALPLGPWDLAGTVRREEPGSTDPPQGFSRAVTPWLPNGPVGQYTFRIGDRSLVITWSKRN
jgi:hypothetical protein